MKTVCREFVPTLSDVGLGARTLGKHQEGAAVESYAAGRWNVGLRSRPRQQEWRHLEC